MTKKTNKERISKVEQDLYGNGQPGLFQQFNLMKKDIKEILQMKVYVKASIFILIILSFDDVKNIFKFVFSLIK